MLEVTCVNSLTYADDMVLLASTVTALLTLLNVCHSYAGPHDQHVSESSMTSIQYSENCLHARSSKIISTSIICNRC